MVAFLSEGASGTIFPQHFATLLISGDTSAAKCGEEAELV